MDGRADLADVAARWIWSPSWVMLWMRYVWPPMSGWYVPVLGS